MRRSRVLENQVSILKRGFTLSVLLLLLSGASTLMHAEELLNPTFSEAAWQQAYADQRDALLIDFAGDRPAGFKAGLTSTVAQQKFNSDRAVFGVLPPNGEIVSEKPIQIASFGRGMIELEMAFRLKHKVTSKVADIASLKALIAEVAPAFELPDLGVLTNAADGALGIVRANVAAHSFVVGDARQLNNLDANKLDVTLYRHGELLMSALTGDMLGGQWQNLLDLINDRVAQGWVIHPDQWLLTGAIGQMLPLQTGRYDGEIKGLGKLTMDVLP